MNKLRDLFYYAITGLPSDKNKIAEACAKVAQEEIGKAWVAGAIARSEDSTYEYLKRKYGITQ